MNYNETLPIVSLWSVCVCTTRWRKHTIKWQVLTDTCRRRLTIAYTSSSSRALEVLGLLVLLRRTRFWDPFAWEQSTPRTLRHEVRELVSRPPLHWWAVAWPWTTFRSCWRRLSNLSECRLIETESWDSGEWSLAPTRNRAWKGHTGVDRRTFSLTFSKEAGDTTEKQTRNTSVWG